MQNPRRLLLEMIAVPAVLLGAGVLYEVRARTGPPPTRVAFRLQAAVEGLGDLVIVVRSLGHGSTQSEATMNIRRLYDTSVTYFEEEHVCRTGKVFGKASSGETTGKLLAAVVALDAERTSDEVSDATDLDLSEASCAAARPLRPDEVDAIAAMISANLSFHRNISPTAVDARTAFLTTLSRVGISPPCP